MRVELERVAEIGAEMIPVDTPTRLDIKTADSEIPLLVVRRQATERLTTLCNGAVDLEKSQGNPVFQRSTWWEEIQAHQIYVCDPGTVGPDALHLAWGQLSNSRWFVPDAAIAIRALATILGVPHAEKRHYYGSSAGGFLALALASYDSGCHVTVNNAQFDWTTWMEGAVNALRSRRFNNMVPAALRSKFPTRTNALNLITENSFTGRIDYWVNLASPHDRLKALPLFEQFMLDRESSLNLTLRLHKYNDPDHGHNPLAKKASLALINGS